MSRSTQISWICKACRQCGCSNLEFSNGPSFIPRRLADFSPFERIMILSRIAAFHSWDHPCKRDDALVIQSEREYSNDLLFVSPYGTALDNRLIF